MDTQCNAMQLEFQGLGHRKIQADFDATDDPIHGNQEGRFFYG